MSKGGGTPQPPDPRDTASAEAQYNRINTYSPSGSGVRHGYTNSRGNFVQGPAPGNQQAAMRYLESPHETQIRQTLEPASVDLTQRLVSDNVDNMPGAARVRARSDVADDIFNRNFSLMSPGIDQASDRLLTNLQARGIPIGSEAFNETYGDQVTRTQDTIARLAMDANIAAGQEQSREFSLDAAARSGAISELQALMGGGYSPASALPSGNAANINYSGMVGQQYQAEMDRANQRSAQQMNTASTVGSLGAALIKSARDTKTMGEQINIQDAADALMTVPVWSWEYLPHERPAHDHGGVHVGPTADDFHAATGLGRPDRIDMIDYCGTMLAALQTALLRIEALEARRSSEDTIYTPLTRLN